MNEYDGHWITLNSGKKFHYLSPRPEEIDIKDIAHALTRTCRFSGHCREFYSVAEHSNRMIEIVTKELKLLALLHDASEAYLPDLPRPIKADLPQFKTIEKIIMKNILNKYIPLGYDLSKIKMADNIMLATEARDLLPNMDDWEDLPEPLEETILPNSSFREVEALFLYNFRNLCNIRNAK